MCLNTSVSCPTKLGHAACRGLASNQTNKAVSRSIANYLLLIAIYLLSKSHALWCFFLFLLYLLFGHHGGCRGKQLPPFGRQNSFFYSSKPGYRKWKHTHSHPLLLVKVNPRDLVCLLELTPPPHESSGMTGTPYLDPAHCWRYGCGWRIVGFTI